MKLLEKAERRLNRLSEEQFYLILLGIMTIIVATLVMNLALGIQRNFTEVACDTAAYHSAIVNSLNGSWFRDTAYAGPNLLGCSQHVQFILLPVAIIYYFFQTADTLFILQVWGIYGAVIPLYLLGLEIVKRPLPVFLVAVTALSSPFFYHMAMAPFHPESWIFISVLGAWYFYRRNRLVGFWTCLGVALTCGEQSAFIAILWGTSLLIWDDGLAWSRRYGKMSLIAGTAWLIFSTGLVAPLMYTPGQDNLISYHYPNWHADTALRLIQAILQDPVGAVALLLAPGRWFYLILITGLPLLWALSTRRTLIFLVLLPVYLLMTEREFFLYIHSYYFSFIFLAGYLGLFYFLLRWDLSTRMGITIIVATLFFNIPPLCSAIRFYEHVAIGGDVVLNQKFHELFKGLPPEAGVYAQHRYSAYLSSHANMVMGDLSHEDMDFEQMVEGRYPLTTVHASDIEFIVCDLISDQCGWRQGGYDRDATKHRTDNLDRLVKSGQWRYYSNADNLVILQRVGR